MSSEAHDGDAQAAEVAIAVRRISKSYVQFARPEDWVKQAIVPRVDRVLKRPRTRSYATAFRAVHDVSFVVRKGETVGILGRNGSGKSTLLQIVCGILQPTEGRVETRGRISALLELGAGFNPEFSGRENVFFSGVILGLGRDEVARKFDQIVAFSGIGAFIDRPVKTYSSGMFVRLAFAVAISLDPDILVVDEALAVGDEAFQRKCFAAIEEFQSRGGTLLLVSHNAQTVIQLCDRALLIDGGELLLDGPPKPVSTQYQRLVNLSAAEAEPVRQDLKARCAAVWAGTSFADGVAEPAAGGRSMDTKEPDSGTPQDLQTASGPHLHDAADDSQLEAFDPAFLSTTIVAYERHGATIRDLTLRTVHGRPVTTIELGRRYIYRYFVDFDAEAVNVGFGMLINSASGLGIAGATTAYHRAFVTRHVAAETTIRVEFEFICALMPGVYFLNAGVLGATDGEERYLHRLLDGLMFRVCAAQALTATGLVDLGIRPAIHVEPRSAPGVDAMAVVCPDVTSGFRLAS